MHNIFGWIGFTERPLSREWLGENERKYFNHAEFGSHKSHISVNYGILYETPRLLSASVFKQDKGICVVLGDGRWKSSVEKEKREARYLAENLWLEYKQNGQKALSKLSGTTFVLIFDSEQKKSILASDRIGQIRIYYRLIQNTLFFSSTAISLAKSPLPELSIDMQAIFNYIHFHVIPGPQTAFKDVFVLEPGNTLVTDTSGTHLSSYWKMEYHEEYNSFDPGTSTERFRSLIREAVERQSAKGEVGAFLSGGLDSSTVSGFLKEVKKDASAPTFSIGFAEEGYDEMYYARLSAKHFGTEHHEYYVTPEDVVSLIPGIASTYSEPFGNSSCVPVFYCARLAQETGIETLLAGDGGDELFGGNERYRRQLIFELYNKFPCSMRTKVLEPMSNSALIQSVPGIKKFGRYISQASIPMPDRMEAYNVLKWIGIESILTPEFASSVDLEAPAKHTRSIYNQIESDSVLNRMLGYDMRLTLTDNDLPKVNGMCRLAGVKVEYPLLTDELLTFSGHLPPKLKTSSTKLRIFYKQALKDYLAPETIKKTKHGFGLPVGPWLLEDADFNAIARSSITALAGRGVIRKEFVDSFFDEKLQEHPGFYGTIGWVFMMLEQWLQAHELSL